MSDPSSPQNADVKTEISAVHASTVHVAIMNSDFVIVFGIAKPAWSSRQGLVAGGALEAVAAVSLSAVAVKQLIRQLQQAVTGFETATNSTVPEFG